MDVTPHLTVAQFEKLEPGDLFIYLTDRGSCFALKTDKAKDGDPSEFLILGPDFSHDVKEALLVKWQAAAVVSFGKNYKIILPTNPSNWFLSGNTRLPVCLAVCGEDVYICANGGSPPGRFFQCFVEVKTGKILESRPPGIIALTSHWEIALPGAELRTILKYSGEEKGDDKP